MVEVASGEPLPVGVLDAAHYRAIHRHLFGGVYAWAGRDREIRVSKGASVFCYPEWIEKELDKAFRKLAATGNLQQLSRLEFAKGAASFLSDVNAVHPFREGNGRTMKSFLALLAEQAGHPIDIRRIKTDPYMKAMIAAFNGDETLLVAQIESWIVE